MKNQSKRMRELGLLSAGKENLQIGDAVLTLSSLEKQLPAAIKRCKFDQTVVASALLGIDPKQADQAVRGSIVLPHGIGRTRRVIVFAAGDNANSAKSAGADEVGAKDLAEKIRAGYLDFDVAIATPDMMGIVGPLGKVLGPRGLMPSPKSGTVCQDVAAAVREYKKGKVDFKNDSGGNIFCVIGKLSFPPEQLEENFQAFVKTLRSLKPQTSKGIFIRRLSIGATMSPSITVAG